MINIEYNKDVVDVEINDLAKAIQVIVSDLTGIRDVFVYANSAEVKINVAPIEIFVRLSEHLAENPKELNESIKKHLSEWKTENNFQHLINLTIIPMNWSIEIGI